MNSSLQLSLLMPLLVTVAAYWIYKTFRFRPFGSVKNSIVKPALAYLLTVEYLWIVYRFAQKLARRKKTAARGTMLAFISADDPHSFLMLQCLEILLKKPSMPELEILVIQPGSSSWAKGDTFTWVLKDSQHFADLYGMQSPDDIEHDKTEGKINAATLALLKHNGSNKVNDCLTILRSVWNTKELGSQNHASDIHSLADPVFNSTLQLNMQILKKVGYYGPGVVEFEGEIYTLPRLHHLERRVFGIKVKPFTFLPSAIFLKLMILFFSKDSTTICSSPKKSKLVAQRPRFCQQLQPLPELYMMQIAAWSYTIAFDRLIHSSLCLEYAACVLTSGFSFESRWSLYQ